MHDNNNQNREKKTQKEYYLSCHNSKLNEQNEKEKWVRKMIKGKEGE